MLPQNMKESCSHTSCCDDILAVSNLSNLGTYYFCNTGPAGHTDYKRQADNIRISQDSLQDSLKHTHFSFESIAMILIGFTCTGTFQLWLNCAQNFAKENVGWADPSIMQTYYSAGTLIALVVTALLTRKIKDVRFIVIYPVICLATLIVVLTGQNQTLMIAGAFIIGWAGAGGLLQIATSVCNMLFPKIKGTVTALVMIASSLCNYTILTAASKMQPSQVMIMNIVLTAVGVVLGLFVNIRYKKMVELAEAEN